MTRDDAGDTMTSGVDRVRRDCGVQPPVQFGCERLRQERQRLERIFFPRRLALIGVSNRGNLFGSGTLSALLEIGFGGRIYPVNPKGGDFRGLKIWESIDAIPEAIDLALIMVPAPAVPAALEHCRLKGAAGAVILSSGFRESGSAEGAALEEQVQHIAARGIRVIGPNCFGVYCPRSGLTFPPGPDLSRRSGTVAFLSQSGGMAVDLAHMGQWMGLGFSKMISFGNGADLRETELLEYLYTDAETHVIAMYLEGLDEGRRFFDTLKTVTARKPVVVFKGGLSQSGRAAAASHTGSLAGGRRVWQTLLRQCNAVPAHDLAETAAICLAFAMLPPGVYRNVSVTGGGGALGVGACDLAEANGLVLPPLAAATVERVERLLPQPGSSAGNPIDAANPFLPPAAMEKVLLETAQDPRIELQIVIQLLYHYQSLLGVTGAASVEEITPYRELAEALGRVVRQSGKPIVLVLPNNRRHAAAMDVEAMMREARAVFLKKGLPVFDDLKVAMGAVRRLSDYYAVRR